MKKEIRLTYCALAISEVFDKVNFYDLYTSITDKLGIFCYILYCIYVRLVSKTICLVQSSGFLLVPLSNSVYGKTYGLTVISDKGKT